MYNVSWNIQKKTTSDSYNIVHTLIKHNSSDRLN